MSFISYAQNYEDVMLHRALRDVENGFYVDIGAAWPDEHSVTQAFYLMGWSGINVEPNPAFHALLMAQRMRDLNLQVAIGEHSGTATLNLISDTGLSTLDNAIAETHQHSGWSPSNITVETMTLAELWQRHVPPGQPVHFLKVDIEGYETVALASHDWQTYRPWIVLVEATLPMTQQENHGQWEPILIDARYHFVYADGLNRFYVAQEQLALRQAFQYPPNVFDDFKPKAQITAVLAGEQLLDQLNQERHLAESRLTELNQQRDFSKQLQAKIIEAQNALQHQASLAEYWLQFAKQKEQQLNEMRANWGWKFTEPFRRWGRSYQKRRVRLAAWWQRLHHKNNQGNVTLLDRTSDPSHATDLAMTPLARQIHDELKQAIAARKQ